VLQALIPLPHQLEQRLNIATGQPEPVLDEDEDEDEAALLARVPEDAQALQEIVSSFQGCLLLLVLRQHLKELYGLSDA